MRLISGNFIDIFKIDVLLRLPTTNHETTLSIKKLVQLVGFEISIV